MLTKIKSDLKKSMIAKDSVRRDTLRMILGEIPRLNKKVDEIVTDEEILKIIEKLIKSELIMLEASGIDEKNSEYVQILKSYLPKKMTEHEIITWIFSNIDIYSFNPRIKAMGAIMKGLSGKVDGNTVKKILMNM